MGKLWPISAKVHLLIEISIQLCYVTVAGGVCGHKWMRTLGESRA